MAVQNGFYVLYRRKSFLCRCCLVVKMVPFNGSLTTWKYMSKLKAVVLKWSPTSRKCGFAVAPSGAGGIGMGAQAMSRM
jgi:hypothetical protein